MSRTPLIAAGLAVALAAGAAAQEKRKIAPGQPAPVPPPAAQAPRAPQPPAAQAPRPADPPAVAALRRLAPGLPFRFATATEDGPRTRLTGVVMGPAGQEVRAAEMVLEGVTPTALGSLTATGLTAAWGGMDSLSLAGFALPGAVPQAERLEVTNLRVTGPWAGGFARLLVRDAVPGRDATLEATEMRLEPQDRSVVAAATLRRLAVSATDIQGLIGIIIAARANPANPPEAPAGRQSLIAEGLEIRGPAARLGGMDRLALSGENRPGTPATGRIALEGVELAANTPASAWLAPFGYEGLRGDLTLDATQDIPRGRLEIGALALAVREVAALGLSVTMDGVRAGTDPAQAYQNASLVQARLRYADQSLYARALARQARESGRREADIRLEWARLAEAQLPEMLRPPVLRFIRGEARELEITARPARPVPFSSLSKPPTDAAGWQRLLGLTVTAR